MWEVVDLDGTLVGIETRSLLRLRLILWKPFEIRSWMRTRRISSQAEKIYLQDRVPLTVKYLPYNKQVVSACRQAKAGGSRIVLATASSQLLADSVAEYLGGIDEVFGSSVSVNLKGTWKLEAILNVLEESPFRYWGNSNADTSIWAKASIGCVVLGRASRKIPTEILAGLLTYPDVPRNYKFWCFVRLLLLPPIHRAGDRKLSGISSKKVIKS